MTTRPGMDPKQMLEHIIRPTLAELAHASGLLGIHTPAAEAMILGIFAAESQLGRWVKQVGSGPALGWGQMEPATYVDLWGYLKNRQPRLSKGILLVLERDPFQYHSTASHLIWDPRLMVSMTRVHLWRDPSPLPAADDLQGQAALWKRIYNTEAGAGSVEGYMNTWNWLVKGRI